MTANRLDNGRSIVGSGADIDNFGKSNEKLFKSRKSTISGNSGATEESNFLISSIKKAFNLWRQASTKAPILRHFDLECHIWIETNTLGYTIGDVLSQLSIDWLISNDEQILIKSDFGQWNSVAYFFRKIILIETQYEVYIGELLAIIEIFKTWRHYLEGCKHKAFIFIDHKNFCRFINIKNLSSRQV